MENIASESDMVLVNIINKYQDYLITKFVRITYCNKFFSNIHKAFKRLKI